MPERVRMTSDFLPEGTEKIVAAAVGALTGALSFFFGLDTKPLIIWLAIFIAADLLTGIAAAFVNRDFESRIVSRGLLKKGLMFIVVGFAHGLDVQFSYTLNYLAVFQGIVIAAYGFTEFMSIIENLDRMNLGGCIPLIIRKALKQINTRLDETVEEIGDKPKEGKNENRIL